MIAVRWPWPRRKLAPPSPSEQRAAKELEALRMALADARAARERRGEPIVDVVRGRTRPAGEGR